ncbi:MAG: hypothetical protein CL796_00950 [Chloroflexi bacterium]|jgi:uncharacterized membrane protein YbaN (DUF454 family)|nr:hypothetical protein [Chloroflexota bacterium]|tara:strand:- start:47 stop:439 length:393 start_codon:yes stop_codon:yes gene_type:complete
MSKLNKHKSIRILWILFGSISVGLGVIGIFVPGWPTTIFLIIASYFYIRSSEKLYMWLINNRLLGIYIKNYLSGKGMPLKAKLISIFIMWVFGLLSITIWIPATLLLVKIVVLLLLIIGTLFILRVKTSK